MWGLVERRCFPIPLRSHQRYRYFSLYHIFGYAWGGNETPAVGALCRVILINKSSQICVEVRLEVADKCFDLFDIRVGRPPTE